MKEKIYLKVLKKPSEKIIGFQHKKEPKENQGLLFAFKQEKILNFHMRNVNFDLDIIFLDKNGFIKSFKKMKSNAKETYSSGVPCKFAIELKKGSIEKLKLKLGKKISFNPLY